MPRVLQEAQPEKSIVCHHCRRTIGYVPSDVQEYHGTDIGGGPDGCTYITCPGTGCGKRIVLTSW